MKLKTTFTFIVLICVFSIVILTNVDAQSDNKFGLSLSPAIKELNPGESYDLTLQNNTDISQQVTLKPVILYFEDPQTRETYQFIDNETVQPQEYVSISNQQISLDPQSTTKVNVTYIQGLEGFIPGVKVSRVLTNDTTQISTNSEIVSLILDYNLEEADILGISTSLRSTLNVEVLDIEISNRFTLKTEIYNDSKKLIKPSGEIEVFEGELKIGSVSLTQKISKSLLPGESMELESEFVDVRGPWDRLGRLTFKQKVKFDEQVSLDEISFFVLPYQVILYLLALILIIIFGIRIFLKRKEIIVNRKITTKKEIKLKTNDKKKSYHQ